MTDKLPETRSDPARPLVVATAESLRSRMATTSFDYDPHDWRSHLFDVRGNVLSRIAWRMLSMLSWTIAVTATHMLVRPIGFSDKIIGITGIAVSLFLVFRTNSSYDRFWEGRKQWGSMVNETRNLARMTEALLGASTDRAARIIRWTSVFPYAVKEKLRGRTGLGGPLAKLPPGEVRDVERAGHVPLAVARRISHELSLARAEGRLSDITFVELDRVVLLLIDYMGACERILSTPIPFGYVVHLRRALIIYLGLFPFEFVDVFGWGTIGIAAVVGFILLGIEEIGIEIENPFGETNDDLPLDTFCAGIERNLTEVVDDIERRRA